MAERRITHEMIRERVKKGRRIIILTFILLIVAFIENWYLNCSMRYGFPACELGWIYICLAGVVAGVAVYYRK